MGTVRTLPTPTAGVRLADAAKVFLGTIPVVNTRRGYAVVLDRLVRDFGADGNVALLDPDRVAGSFSCGVAARPRRSTSGWPRYGRRAGTGATRAG